MEKNFINYHVLISHSPSCLNRDDMNMQKSAIFGGKRRVRISSQSLKRAMRKSDYYKDNLGETSIRSCDLGLLKDEFMQQYKDEFDEPIIKEALERFSKTKAVEEDEDAIDVEKTETTSDKKIAVAPWIKDEFKIICQIVKEARGEGLSPEEEEKANQAFQKQKGKKKRPSEHFLEIAFAKKIDKKLEASKIALIKAISSAIDVAFSGRMATSGLMTTIDGSFAVAHVITTHSVDGDIDWFTAVDDLQEQGSGHLDTQEFSSGVFYRYASLNLRQLQLNLGLIPNIKSIETPEGRKEALNIAAHVLHMMTTVVPSAKQHSFAAHNLADFAFVSFADIPISLANAFEEPVKASPGFIKPSVKAFHGYWENVHNGYGLDEHCAQFALGHDTPQGVVKAETLEKLKAWVKADGNIVKE
ncbi:MAG TPA: type I-E CRISPR-associated protein Cas7/Cse4/CasC [Alphaproteobacteria bacterium]|nr:type I-E CRISPR-associated protein Cas7/Cse4/CasC [Alphaproteobacteria bacterium]